MCCVYRRNVKFHVGTYGSLEEAIAAQAVAIRSIDAHLLKNPMLKKNQLENWWSDKKRVDAGVPICPGIIIKGDKFVSTIFYFAYVNA